MALTAAIVSAGVLATVMAGGAGQPASEPAVPPTTAPVKAPAAGDEQTTKDGAAALPKPSDAAAEMPPSRLLGLRAAMVRVRLPINPTLVVVPDGASYVAALEQWDFNEGVRFPVLIDDGSWAARQAIARFSRAMKPKQVLRWKAPADAPAWPAEAAARHVRLERAAAKAWGVVAPADAAADWKPAPALAAKWKELKYAPPGVVISNAEDGAWPAALALAAGRGQPLGWMSSVGKPDGYMQPDDAATLQRRIEIVAEGTGYTWKTTGDDLDAITLCLNCSTKVFLGSGDQRAMLSLTDWLGRIPGETAAKGPTTERWAWAGQIIGNEWQSAYAAMSSLFLDVPSAWLFDGYESSPPWNTFDMTTTATTFEKAGIKTTLDDDSNRSIGAWQRRASKGGVDAAVVMVNSSGNQDFFDLKPGQGRPADVPILRRPAMVHFVHSWSAAAPSDPATVAGRWLERGAFAYVGSVHEPYLQAFVPPPKLVLRLGAGMPLCTAARLDRGEVWKVSVLGDPLWTLSKPGPLVEKNLPLAGASDAAEDLAGAVKERDFTRALTDLLLLGRDGDATDLLAAVLREDKAKLTPEGAMAGLTSAFVMGQRQTFIDAFAVAQPRVGSEAEMRTAGAWDARDMLWHLLAPSMGSLSQAEVELLEANLRGQTLVRDASDVYSAMTTASGKEAARAMLGRAAQRASGDAEKRQLEQIGR